MLAKQLVSFPLFVFLFAKRKKFKRWKSNNKVFILWANKSFAAVLFLEKKNDKWRSKNSMSKKKRSFQFNACIDDRRTICVFELCLKFEQKLKKRIFFDVEFWNGAWIIIIGLWVAHPIGIMNYLNGWMLIHNIRNTKHLSSVLTVFFFIHFLRSLEIWMWIKVLFLVLLNHKTSTYSRNNYWDPLYKITVDNNGKIRASWKHWMNLLVIQYQPPKFQSAKPRTVTDTRIKLRTASCQVTRYRYDRYQRYLFIRCWDEFTNYYFMATKLICTVHNAQANEKIVASAEPQTYHIRQRT